MRILVFGGSFNPIHTGHAMIANYVAQSGIADCVWIMVSPQNPLKPSIGDATDQDRMEMARLVASECRNVEASDFEFNLPIPSYTYDTLISLKAQYPQHQFKLLIGSDNWNIFSQWKNSRRIIDEFGVVIFRRPDAPIAGELPQGAEIIENTPMVLLSSTKVREMIKENKSVKFLLPDSVLAYVEQKGLYND